MLFYSGVPGGLDSPLGTKFYALKLENDQTKKKLIEKRLDNPLALDVDALKLRPNK